MIIYRGYSEPCQISNMERSARTGKKPLAIFTKHSVLDVINMDKHGHAFKNLSIEYQDYTSRVAGISNHDCL